jgi:demethylmenaquinone methyltransferase/2-methoxy-6-polyprenyl-1,4-benzoquinol methylase
VTSLGDLFAELARVVRLGGRISLLETAEPQGTLMRLGHRVYFRRVVPAIGGLLSDRTAYAYLPRSAVYLPPVGDVLSTLRTAGFTDARRLPLGGGVTQLFVATRS